MNITQVAQYFDDAADCYQRHTDSFPWSAIRKREAQSIHRHIPSLENLNVLDACCGNGFYTEMLASGGSSHLTAVDLSGKMLAQLRLPGVKLVQGDLCKLDLDERFDMILCAGGLEFMDSPTAFFAWTARHARPEALMLLLTPPKSVAGYLYQAYHRLHCIKISLFHREGLYKLGASAGWRPVLFERVHAYAQLIMYRLEK